MRSFGSVVTSLRKEKELKQEEFAEQLSKLCGQRISRSAVSMWETDQRRPKYEIIEAIADWFNVDTDYVLGKTEERFRIKNPAAYDGDGIELTDKQKEFIRLVSQLSDQESELLLRILQSLLHDQQSPGDQ